MRKLAALAHSDLRNTVRDRVTLVLFAMPALIVLTVRFLVPLVLDQSHALAPYRPVVVLFLAVLGGSFPAFVAAFNMLDEKDAGLFAALRVTPIAPRAFLVYRLGAVTLIAMVTAGAALLASGHAGSLGQTLVLATLMGATAALTALGVVAYARSKIEGTVALKLVSVAIVLPAFAALADSSWKYVLGVLPPFWTYLAFLEGERGSFFKWAALSAGAHAVLLVLLYRRFRAHVY